MAMPLKGLSESLQLRVTEPAYDLRFVQGTNHPIRGIVTRAAGEHRQTARQGGVLVAIDECLDDSGAHLATPLGGCRRCNLRREFDERPGLVALREIRDLLIDRFVAIR